MNETAPFPPPSNGPTRRWPSRVASALLIAGAVLVLVVNWPGHLSFDSAVQLAEGRAGRYEGWHPPLMSWLLGTANALWPGVGLFIALDTTMIFAGLIALVGLGRGPGWIIVAAAASVMSLPQLLVYPAIVWKDVLFAASAAAGFACLAHAAVVWSRRGSRAALLVLGAILLASAALARQNGPVILPFAAAAVGWTAATQGGAAPLRRGLAAGAAYLAVVGLMTAAGAATLSARTTGVAVARNQWAMLQTYDLAGALRLTPRLRLTVLDRRAPRLSYLLRRQTIDFTPASADSLSPVLDRVRTRPELAADIAAQWRALMSEHPSAYLRSRVRAFEWVFLTPLDGQCRLVATGVVASPSILARAGLRAREDDRDDALADYVQALGATPACSHAVFAGLALLVLAMLLKRRRGADGVVAAMISAALAFTLTFAIISVGCDYRYLYDLDLTAIGAVLYAIATWGERRGGGQTEMAGSHDARQALTVDTIARRRQTDWTSGRGRRVRPDQAGRTPSHSLPRLDCLTNWNTPPSMAAGCGSSSTPPRACERSFTGQ